MGHRRDSSAAGKRDPLRVPTAWEEYREPILTTCAVLLLQAAMIVWLLYKQRRRRHSEAAAHELSGRFINAQEEERSRLARELHDDVTQRLALLAIDAGREERNLPILPAATRCGRCEKAWSD